MAIIKALDLSEFSTTIQTINGEETSYYALAQKAVAQLSSQMDATVIAENDDYATIKIRLAISLDSKISTLMLKMHMLDIICLLLHVQNLVF